VLNRLEFLYSRNIPGTSLASGACFRLLVQRLGRIGFRYFSIFFHHRSLLNCVKNILSIPNISQNFTLKFRKSWGNTSLWARYFSRYFPVTLVVIFPGYFQIDPRYHPRDSPRDWLEVTQYSKIFIKYDSNCNTICNFELRTRM